jgi:2-dehydropantoate 2-reductase
MSTGVHPAGPLVSVIGGGAVGGLLTALLARAGSPVELVVRERYLEQYQAGVAVTTGRGTFRQRVPVRTAPSREAELLVIAVKMPDLAAACRDIADATQSTTTGPGPEVLLLQNGLAALDIAARYLPLPRLYAAVVELGATSLTPTDITYSIPGRLLLGAARAGNEAKARRVAGLLAPAVRTDVTADVRGAQRLKLLVNLNNGVGAATGLTIQQLYATRTGIRASLGVMREGLAVLDAAGLAPPANRRSRALRAILSLPDAVGIGVLHLARIAMRQRAPVYSSTLQSLIRRRPSEIEWLNGSIVRLGEEQGVPVPLNRAVVTAVEALECGRGETAYVQPASLLARARDGDWVRPPLPPIGANP